MEICQLLVANIHTPWMRIYKLYIASTECAAQLKLTLVITQLQPYQEFNCCTKLVREYIDICTCLVGVYSSLYTP